MSNQKWSDSMIGNKKYLELEKKLVELGFNSKRKPSMYKSVFDRNKISQNLDEKGFRVLHWLSKRGTMPIQQYNRIIELLNEYEQKLKK